MQIQPAEVVLFQNLMALCATTEKDVFYFQDFPVDNDEGTVYRVFNYRLASYTEFMKPGALECRGIMFEVDPLYSTPLRLASRPPKKFFNYGENPSVMFDYDIRDRIAYTMNKEDGSLISSYLHYASDVSLRLKSRGSVASGQSAAAEQWLYNEKRTALYNEMLGLEEAGWTVISEWTSPENRIVLPYYKEHLTILSIRNRETGHYMPLDVVKQCYPHIWLHYVSVNPETWSEASFGAKTFDDVLRVLRAQTGIEGHVVALNSPNGDLQFVKFKNDWYVALHHTKDSVTNPRRLFECVIDDATDDLRQMFETDPQALLLISDAEEKYIPMYNALISRCEEFYHNNKDLERKEFALLGQEVFKGEKLPYFSCCMTLYSGRQPEWKEIFKKQYKALGIKDTSTEE